MTTATIQNPAFSAFKLEERISFIRPYNPTECIEIAGMRNSIIRYKDGSKSKGTTSKPAKVVCVPETVIPESYLMPDVAKKVFLACIDDQIDLLIRQAIDNDASVISWDDISLDKALDALTAVRTSQRLTRDQVIAWVNASLETAINSRADAISAGKGYGKVQADIQRAQTKLGYTNAFATLSAPVPSIKQNSAMACKNLLIDSKLDDDICKALLGKLDKILNPEVDTDNL